MIWRARDARPAISTTALPPPASRGASAFPRSCIELYRASIAGDVAPAVPLYQALHPLLRWDSRTEFVQAIKLSMDLVGRAGGPCRPPRLALSEDHSAAVRQLTEAAIAAGMR